MRPMFVEVRKGEKSIRWLRLLAFSVGMIAIGATLGELAAYLATGAQGTAAPVLGAVIGLFLAVRQFAAVLAYQLSEIDEETYVA